MKKELFIINVIILLLTMNCKGQLDPFYVYDFQDFSLDSIPTLTNSDSVIAESYSYSFGSYNSILAELSETVTANNAIPGTNFTFKEKVNLNYELTNFPIRTCVKLSSIENGNNIDWCTGTLISNRHVLTAAHCLIKNNSNEPNVDSILACPIFDNGGFNSEFNCSLGKKVFFIKNWSLGSRDLAIIELEESIGDQTGWIGIGFNNLKTFYDEGIYYKFSYPASYLPFIDSTEYNGDTLYASYGNIDLLNSNSLGVTGAVGIPGESGSSLILIDNDSFTSHAVLSLGNYVHTRIQDWMYYTIVDGIIKNDIISSSNDIYDTNAIEIYPNPVKMQLTVKGLKQEEQLIIIVDNLGKSVRQISNFSSTLEIDMTNLTEGIYYLKIVTKNGIHTRKLIKN